MSEMSLYIIIPIQSHCVTIKQFLSILPSSVCVIIKLSVSVDLLILDILYILCLCFLLMPWMHTDLFSMKFYSFPIVFVTQAICVSAKNPTVKCKVTKNCPCFPPRLLRFVSFIFISMIQFELNFK